MACTQQSADVGRGLLTSPLSCTQLSTDVGRIGCHYRPWPAHIDQMTSDVACPHRSYPAGGISEGLHASDVACAHLANDVGNRHGASAKACTHQSWRVRIGWVSPAVTCAHHPTAGENGQGLHTLTVVYTLRLSDIDCDLRIGQATSAQRQASSAKTCKHLTWHVRIGQATSANDMRYRSGDIGCGLPASAVTCAHRSVVVGRGLPTSP